MAHAHLTVLQISVSLYPLSSRKSNTMANANANANDEIHKHGKTIILNKLVSSEYRMWVVQDEATLGVYEYLGIVRGTDLNPHPPMNANGAYPHINTAICNRINDWNHRHARAREALL